MSRAGKLCCERKRCLFAALMESIHDCAADNDSVGVLGDISRLRFGFNAKADDDGQA